MGKRRSRGEGSIFYYEKKGLWVAELTLDGKTRRKYEKTQKEARAWLLEMRKQAASGVVVDDRRMTLGQFMDRYYQDIALHSLRPKTLESYESLIRVHIKPGLGSVRLSSLTPAHIQKFYSDKLRSGLSKRTVQYIHSILHKALDYAVRWGLTVRNASDLVDKPSPKRKPVEPLTVEQVNRLLDAVEGTRYFPIIVCACYLGLREGEVLGIHVEDLDLANGILHVRHAVQQLKGQGLVITEPKSDASKQPLKIPEFTIAVLKAHALNQLVPRSNRGGVT
jgi:integrase